MFDLKQSQYIEWKNETLAATIDFPKNLVFGKKYPFIIICHGFIGSKVGVDRLFVKAAEEFTMDGAIVLRFDFAGCGESSGNYGETGLDAFIINYKRFLITASIISNKWIEIILRFLAIVWGELQLF